MKRKKTPPSPAKKPAIEKATAKGANKPMRDEQSILLPLSMIQVEKNIRSDMGDLTALRESIRQHGLMQPLVVVVSKNDGRVVLIAGARRYQCLVDLKQTHAACRTTATDSKGVQTLKLIENLVREDLEGSDEIRAVAELLPLFQGNQSALARAISKDQPYVNRCIRAAKILQDAGYASTHRGLSKTMLFELADSKDPKALLVQLESGAVKSVKEAREKSGPIAGGRFGAEKALQFRNIGDSGRFVLRLAFCPERTPASSRDAMIAQLREVLRRLEQAQPVETGTQKAKEA